MESLTFNSSSLSDIFVYDPTISKSLSYSNLFSITENIIDNHLKDVKEDEKILIIYSDIYKIFSVLIACWKKKIKPFIVSPNLNSDEYQILLDEFTFNKIFTSIDFPKNINIEDFTINQKTLKTEHYFINYQLEDIALVIFSSGTTGLKKAIPLSFKNILSNIESFDKILKTNNSSSYLCTSPVWHAHGLYNSFLTAFFLKRRVIFSGILNLFNVMPLLDYCSKNKNIIYHLTPSMITLLINASKRIQSNVLPKFEKIICGTSYLDVNSKKEFEKIFGQNILQQYGMTEVLFISINDLPKKKPYSVGRPLDIVNVEIEINENLSKSGRIKIKTPSYYGKYFRKSDKETLNKGFFYTGDIGYLDDQGYLFITGRDKDIIKKGGLAISSAKINSVLLSYKNILGAETISIIDSRLGEEIYCFIVANKLINPDDLKTYIKEKISNKFIPKSIIQIKKIPITELGKTSYKDLKNLISK